MIDHLAERQAGEQGDRAGFARPLCEVFARPFRFTQKKGVAHAAQVVVAPVVRVGGDGAILAGTIGAGMMMQALAMLCFWLWPVSFPRELWPVPADAWSLHAQLSEFWRPLRGPKA